MKKPKISTIIIFLVLFGIIVLYIFRGAVASDVTALNLTPVPERFTELYFNDAATLPKETIAKNSSSFSFVIHNVEGATTTYPYKVYFEYPDGYDFTFADSALVLSDGELQTINVSHVWKSSNLTGKVVVELTQKNQKIDFILPNNN